MLNISQYLEQMELNKNDPDYQIEDFWYGFKNSMKNFYKNNELKEHKIQSWSNKLNEYKKEKNYYLIEEQIKEYIIIYALDIMKYDKINNCIYSSILATNIKRWNKLSSKFHFGDLEKNEQIIILFEAFNFIKCKMDKKLYPILKLFFDFNTIISNDYYYLTILSLELGQVKMLDSVTKILGYVKIVKIINEIYPDFINPNEKNITGMNLCRRYKNYITIK
jgi:hypothetical protein